VEGPEQQRQLRFSSIWTFFVGERAMKFSALAFLCAVLAWACAAKATILDWNCNNDGDGAINCAQTGWWWNAGAGEWDLDIRGNQFKTPGHMLMDFTTDSGLDPTIKAANFVTNDTAPYFTWTGYQVDLTLYTDTALTSSSILSAAVTSPGDWLPPAITQPTGGAISPTVIDGKTFNYEYTGAIGFEGGTAIGFGGELDFNYKLTFAGATNYYAVQGMTPIPEPASIALVLSGLAALLAMWRKFA